MIARMLNPVGRLAARVRFRLWALRTRIWLARAGCTLELIAPAGARFYTPPAVRPTLHLPSGAVASGRGHLRIELGEGVHFGSHATIEVVPSAESVLAIGDGVVFGTAVRLALYGGQIRIGAWGTVRDGVMLKASGALEVGEHVRISSYTTIHCAGAITLADYAGLAERITLVDSDHPADGSSTPFLQQPLMIEPIGVGRNTFIATNAVLLRGAQVGENSVVAAGSLVRGGDYPPGWLIAGSPAKALKELAPARAPR